LSSTASFLKDHGNSSDIFSLQTSLTKLFRIQYPIVLAGMGGGLTTPELVAAVSNAGGLGILGATGLSSSEQLRTNS